MTAVPETKVIDADVNAFINSLVSDSHQEIYYRGWVDLFYEEKKSKPRILVITNFRIFSIRIAMLGRSVRQQFPLRDLTLMTAQKDITEKIKLTLEFAGLGEVGIEAPSQQDIVTITQAILFSYQAISFGRPQAEMPRIELPGYLIKDFLPPEPDSQDGLLACYLAECDYVAIPQRIHVLDHLMTCFQLQDRTLDFDECLGFLDKEAPTKDIQAVANSLRNSEWFTELLALGNVQFKSEGLSALAPIFSAPTKITKAVLVNVKAGKTGFGTLAKALGQGKHSLTFLNVSKNKVADEGVEELAKGLDAGKKALHTLSLRDCQVTAKGFKSLQTLLSTPVWLSGLKVLDVSENRAGKAGTQCLAAWLASDAITLEQLHVTSCDIDLEVLLKGMTNNPKLFDKTLRTLNISGNKINKAVGLICTLMIHTGSMAQLFFSECGLTRKDFVAILDAAFRNDRGVNFALDFSSNDLSAKAGKMIEDLYKSKAKEKPTSNPGVIHTLNLSNNGLGVEGIVAVCKALTGTSINTLALDSNLKVGLFTSGKEVGDALAAFINATPALKELSITGDDAGKYYLKTALNTLFTGLKTNKSLLHLDISRNRFGELGMKALAEALAVNDALSSISLDNNKLSMKAIRELHKAISKNKSLCDWQIPMEDIAKVFKGLKNEKKMNELRVIVAEFENIMDRNEQAAQSKREAEEKKATASKAPIPRPSLLPSTPYSAIRGMRMSVIGSDTYGSGGPQRPHHKKTASRMMDSMAFKKSQTNLISDDGDEDGEEKDEDDEDEKGDKKEAKAGAPAEKKEVKAKPKKEAIAEEDDDEEEEEDDDDDDDDDDDKKKPAPKKPAEAPKTPAAAAAPKAEAPKTAAAAAPPAPKAAEAKKEAPKAATPAAAATPVKPAEAPKAAPAAAAPKVEPKKEEPKKVEAAAAPKVEPKKEEPKKVEAAAASKVEPKKEEPKKAEDKKDARPPPGRPSASTPTAAAAASPTASSGAVKYDDWKTKIYTVDQLLITGTLPDGVDGAIRELYLSDSDFKSKFGVDKDAFQKKPKWQQNAEKKKFNLF